MTIENPSVEVPKLSPEGRKLRHFILTSFHNDVIIPNPSKRIVAIGGRIELPVELNTIDDLARKSGLLIGKWLIYESREAINDVWKTIALSTIKGELGVDTKVATTRQSASAKGEYVICVYTKDYQDIDDVHRVRKKLSELGFPRNLCYKPDIYTYLKIYYNTFPRVRASRYVA